MKLGIREAVVSPAVFAAVLLMLASVDGRVRDRFGDLLASGDGLAPLGNRIADLGDAFMTAVRYQSLENAPLLIFATVGAVLVVFMFRS
jgi:hypothetical protein